jgi:hypothetical protein
MLKNNKLFILLAEKNLFPLLAILMILAIIDLTTRLSVDQPISSKNWQKENSKPIQEKRLTQVQAKIVINAITDYSQELNKNVTDNRMSKAQQLAQQGNLNQLYSGDMSYRLMGVFQQNKAFAVILQKNIPTNEEKMRQVGLLTDLNDYQVTKIARNSVTLISSNNRQVTLYLYKKQLNAAIQQAKQGKRNRASETEQVK